MTRDPISKVLSPRESASGLAVIIPALDAAATLSVTLAGIAELAADAVVVVDGGSRDGTPAIARAFGAAVIEAPRGRGRQLAAGAAATTAPWLLFLHADTVPAPGCADVIQRYRTSDGADDRAAYFRFGLDDDHPAARRLERAVAWRCRRLALPYGDQGLLIARSLYDAIGGFRPLPLMEDVDMVRRLGRRRLVALDHPAVTSAERYRRSGYLRRSARNLCCLGLYLLGLPPEHIVRLYR